MSTPTAPSTDPVLQHVGAACLRLVAGAVPASTMRRLRDDLLANQDGFPWREVNDEILADPQDDAELLRRALRGQRDWILRTGREKPARKVATAGQRLLAKVISQAIFFVLYTLAIIVLLVLLKNRWPAIDIYVVLDWLEQWAPGMFGRG